MTVEIPDKKELARRVLETMPLIMRSLHRDLRSINHHVDPNQVQILGMLVDHQLSVSGLAGRQRVSLPSMSKTVSALVERGWIERVDFPGDRRVVHLKLTVSGRAALGELRNTMVESFAAMLGGLTADECEKLSAGLDVLYAAFGLLPEHCPPRDSPAGVELAKNSGPI